MVRGRANRKRRPRAIPSGGPGEGLIPVRAIPALALGYPSGIASKRGGNIGRSGDSRFPSDVQQLKCLSSAALHGGVAICPCDSLPPW